MRGKRFGEGGAHGLQTFCCSLPYYTCPGVPPIRMLYSINLDPPRGYLPLTSTICHRVHFKVTGASCAPTPTLVQLASTCVKNPDPENENNAQKKKKKKIETDELFNYHGNYTDICVGKADVSKSVKYSRYVYSIIPIIANIVTTSLRRFKTNKYAPRSQHSVVKNWGYVGLIIFKDDLQTCRCPEVELAAFLT